MLDAFLATIETTAEVVMHRSLADITRLARADSEIYATFYQRTAAGMTISGGDRWDELRAMADTALFGERNKSEIRFAALSLDGIGSPHYGECAIALRIPMIAHRTSLIEENSAIFMRRHDYRRPAGCLASWARRGTLAAAKLGDALQPATTPAEFLNLVLAPGATSDDGRYIEAHVGGSLTVRSFREVTIRKWKTKPRRVDIKALEEKLAKYNVAFAKPN